MKKIVSNIWHSPSIRNVGKLLSASVFAQALGLLVYPILTRMYCAEDFALLSLFASIAGVLSLIATMEYQYAIVLPVEDSKARSLVHACLLILLLVTGLITLSIPFAPSIANLFKAPDLVHYWWLLPLCVMGIGLWNILNYWYVRRSAFTRISGYQITQSLFAASGKIGLGALNRLSGGLIIATVLAPLVSLCISIALSWKKHMRELCTISRDEIKTVMKQYANFPKFDLPRSLVNSIGQSLPFWLLTPCFGLEQLGYLSLALMAAFVPLNILARTCYQVLFQRVTELVQSHLPIRSVIMKFMAWMGGFLILSMSVVYLFLPQLVTLFFGENWIESAQIIRRLYPYLCFVPFCGTLCFLPDVFYKQKYAMWMETGYVITMTVALLIGTHTLGFLPIISIYGLVGFGYLFIQLFWFLSLVHQYQKTLSMH